MRGPARCHKVECVIYPSTCDSDLGEVLLPEPKPVSVDSNPFGYIHYIPSSSDDSENNGNLVMESEDLITLVLPTQGVEDSLAVAGDEEVVSYHEEDMAALLPRSLLHSESTECPSTRSVSRNDTILSQLGFSNETDESSTPSQGPQHLGPWGKKLPSNDQFDSSQPSADPRFRVASAGGYFEQRPRRPPAEAKMIQSLSAPVLNKSSEARIRQTKQQPSKLTAFKKEESPPNWISCFPSPKHHRKSEDVYYCKPSRCAPAGAEPPMKYIDKTPSANSLNLPYCPPVKLDYEHFSKLDMLTQTNKVQTVQHNNTPRIPPPPASPSQRPRSKSRSASRARARTSSLAVIPVRDADQLRPRLPDTAPVSPRPLRRHRSHLVAHIGGYPVPNPAPAVPEVAPEPAAAAGESGQVSASGCDSRRSSDSGLADMVPSPCLVRRGHTLATPRLGSSADSSLNTSSTSVTVTSHQPHHQPPPPRPVRSEWSLTPSGKHFPLTSPQSVSLDDVQLSDARNEDNIEDAFTRDSGDNENASEPACADHQPKWSRTKEIYKAGLYAHWWLNAALQPISEECVSDKMSENL